MTPLTAWLRYNAERAAAEPDCLRHKYPDFPRQYRWDKGHKRWVKRRNLQAALVFFFFPQPEQYTVRV